MLYIRYIRLYRNVGERTVKNRKLIKCRSFMTHSYLHSNATVNHKKTSLFSSEQHFRSRYQFALSLVIQDNFTWLASLFWMSTVEVLWGLTRVGRSRGRSETDWGWGECGPGWWMSWIFETGVSEVNSFIALLQFQQNEEN